QPILIANCSVCHSGATPPGGLRLDTAGGLLQGSSSGKVIVAGSSKDSLLAQRITDKSGDQMPPSKPLDPKLIAVIVNWIDQGAKAEVSKEEINAMAASALPTSPRGTMPTITGVSTAAQERAMLDYYCVYCHSGPAAPDGLQLD